MPFRKMSSASLRSIIELVEKREALTEEIETINAQVNSYFIEAGASPGNELPSGAAKRPRKTRGKRRMGRPKGSKNKLTIVRAPTLPPAPKITISSTTKPRPPRGKNRVGTVKEAVIATLKAAGKSGIHIEDLAKKVGSTKNSLNVWLYTNRKKNKSIKKSENPGVWGWVG